MIGFPIIQNILAHLKKAWSNELSFTIYHQIPPCSYQNASEPAIGTAFYVELTSDTIRPPAFFCRRLTQVERN